MRPAVKRRFYKSVGLVPDRDGFAIALDGRPVKTPARRPLAVPTRPLGEAHRRRMGGADRGRSIRPGCRSRASPTPSSMASRRRLPRSWRRSRNISARIWSSTAPRRRTALVARQARLWDPILAFRARGARRAFRDHPGRALRDPAGGRGRGGAPSDSGRPVAARRRARDDDAHRLGADRARSGGAVHSRPTTPGRPPMSTRTGTWSSGAATPSRSNGAPRASPRCRRPRRCCGSSHQGLVQRNPRRNPWLVNVRFTCAGVTLR